MALRVFVAALLVVIVNCGDERNDVDSPRGMMDLEDDSITISCNSLDLITEIFSPLEALMSFDDVTVTGCYLPATPLIETFYSLNIDASSISRLTMKDNNLDYPVEDFTKDLKVKAVEFKSDAENAKSDAFVISFMPSLKPTSNVTSLKLTGIDIPTLPLHLEELALSSASVHDWKNCEHLQELTISGQHFEEQSILNEWPVNCSRLKKLTLIEMSKTAAPEIAVYLMNKSPELRMLRIRSCRLSDFPFESLPEQIEYLDLANNYLGERNFSQFPILPNLITLDLSGNHLNGEFLSHLEHKLPVLKNFTLDGNTFLQHKHLPRLVNLPSLTRLSLNEMSLGAGCLKDFHFPHLKFLSLTSGNPIEKIWLNNFPSTNASELDVDIRGRSIGSVIIRPSHFDSKSKDDPSRPWFIKSGTKLTILASILDCDCNNAALTKVLRTYPKILSMPGAKCNTKDGREIVKEPIENMACKIVECSKCICKEKKSWIDSSSVFDCSYQMREKFDWHGVLKKSKLRGINVAGNLLTKPPPLHGLEWMDLRNNHISRLTADESAKLFNPKLRRVWLNGNPITCECNNRAFLDAMHSNKSKVMDFSELVCVETGEPLHKISTVKLCRTGPKVMDFVWGICCAGSALSVGLMLFLRRYGSALRIILYSRGWFSSCLKTDIDADRPYDAFISFAHGDEKFVIEQLIPKLEHGPDEFKLCVHYRDWVVGEWIPAQIMNSVRASKRTVIVLSKNFVQSWWGVLEFRYAHASTMAEGCSRLIVLVLDDVLSEKLAPEMQSYLEYHTFLRCDDPWFWDKLRFAMPHNDSDSHTDYLRKKAGAINKGFAI